MEVFGFLLILIGGCAMDTEGDKWYIAAALVIIGALFMYCGDKVKTAIKRKKRRWYIE